MTDTRPDPVTRALREGAAHVAAQTSDATLAASS